MLLRLIALLNAVYHVTLLSYYHARLCVGNITLLTYIHNFFCSSVYIGGTDVVGGGVGVVYCVGLIVIYVCVVG